MTTYSGFSHSQRSLNRGWPSLVVQSCKLALDYQRCSAPNAWVAFHSFLQTLLPRIKCIVGLGAVSAKKLIGLELACAYAGLGFPSKAAVREPSWWLPFEFLSIPVSTLPPLPLIEPEMLADICHKERGFQPPASDALQMLVSSGGLATRWSELPLIGQVPSIISGPARIAICLHLFYPELWPEIAQSLAEIPEPWDLYVSVPEFACTPELVKIALDHPNVRFLPCPNRGRDILPFIRFLKLGLFDRYDAVCKLHTKRSPHRQDGEAWRKQMLRGLLGEMGDIANHLQLIRNNPKLGLLGPSGTLIPCDNPLHLGSNSKIVHKLASRMGLPDDSLMRPFFAGTMFWFRAAAFEKLRLSSLEETDFSIEMGQIDGTLAHALERLILPLVEKAGYSTDTI